MSPYSDRNQGGRFTPADGPTAKRIEVWLDQPTLAIVDAHANAIGLGRGKAIADLLKPTASGGTPERSQPPDLSDLERLFSPDRKPLFVGKDKGFWERTGVPMAENYAFVADNDCRGLVRCVLELQRDDYWRQHCSDWDEFCQQVFHRPAAWVEQVIESVRVLHCSPGIEEPTASGAAEPAVEPAVVEAPSAPVSKPLKAPPKAVRELVASRAIDWAKPERIDTPTARHEATALELLAQKLRNPRQRWEFHGAVEGWLEWRLHDALGEVESLKRERAQAIDGRGIFTPAEVKQKISKALADAAAYRSVAAWLQI